MKVGVLGSQEAEEFTEGEGSRFDWTLLITILGILLIGMLTIHSAAADHDEGNFGLLQLRNAAVALGLGGAILLVDYRLFERVAYIVYSVNLLGLALVPFIGTVRYGARRWINFGFASWQPSETMKLCTVLALAKYFQNRITNEKLGLRELLIPVLMIAVPGLLTIIQPDLGTGGHLMIGCTVILLFVGVRTRILVSAALVAIVSFPVFWQYGLKPYQKARIMTFMNPTNDPRGEGYNAIQSLIAVGSGELFGRGYQQGTQTQLEFTPEGHTDFIFTALAEEWGFMGAITLFLLYLIMFARCVNIAAHANDTFGSIVCVGFIGMLMSQIFINTSMVCGMFPIVGIPLPLVSYGGSTLVTVSFGLSLILNIGYRRGLF